MKDLTSSPCHRKERERERIEERRASFMNIEFELRKRYTPRSVFPTSLVPCDDDSCRYRFRILMIFFLEAVRVIDCKGCCVGSLLIDKIDTIDPTPMLPPPVQYPRLFTQPLSPSRLRSSGIRLSFAAPLAPLQSSTYSAGYSRKDISPYVTCETSVCLFAVHRGGSVMRNVYGVDLDPSCQ